MSQDQKDETFLHGERILEFKLSYARCQGCQQHVAVELTPSEYNLYTGPAWGNIHLTKSLKQHHCISFSCGDFLNRDR
jgi:hypothetical protein